MSTYSLTKTIIMSIHNLTNIKTMTNKPENKELLIEFSQYLGVDCGIVIYDMLSKVDGFLSQKQQNTSCEICGCGNPSVKHFCKNCGGEIKYQSR